MPSKRDALRTTLQGQGYTSGSVSDRLLAREKAIYEAGPKTYFSGPLRPRSLMDYMRANGTSKKVLF
jgi:hypothetical protein